MTLKWTMFSLLAAWMLTGCSLPGARPQAIKHYLLAAVETPTAATLHADSSKPVLLIRDAEASGFAQTTRLIFSRSPGTRAQYQYAHWVEPPAKRLQTLLRERLLASGLYAGVAPIGAGIQGDYQLNFRVLDLYHDVVHPPGLAKIKLEAELVQRSNARLISQQVFFSEQPVARADADAAALALGQASSQALDTLEEWLIKVQPGAVDRPQAR